MVMDSVGIVLTRTTLVEEEKESWRWGRMGSFGDDEDKDFFNDGNKDSVRIMLTVLLNCVE